MSHFDAAEQNRLALRALVPACLTVGVIYTLLGTTQHWTAPRPASTGIIALQLSTAMIAFAGAASIAKRPVPPHWAHPILLGLVGLASLNLTAYGLWGARPESTIFNALALVGISVAIASRWSLAVATAMILGAWWVAATPDGGWPSGEWRYWSGFLVASIPVAVGILEIRHRAARRDDEIRTLREERLENQLRLREAALREQEHLAALGMLTAGIAHQVGNPVGAILASAELALLESSPDTPASTEVALEEIRVQALRAGRLVRSVLSRARDGHGERWDVDLFHLLRIAIQSVSKHAREHDATIALDAGNGFDKSVVYGNALEIEEALVNLLRNAIESRPGGAQVRVAAHVEENEAVVLIEDDGPGVPRSEHGRIFDAFQSSKLDAGGTGLGLFVAKQNLEAHGGRLELADPEEPMPGPVLGGARFVLRLPLQAARVKGSAECSQSDSRAGEMNPTFPKREGQQEPTGPR